MKRNEVERNKAPNAASHCVNRQSGGIGETRWASGQRGKSKGRNRQTHNAQKRKHTTGSGMKFPNFANKNPPARFENRHSQGCLRPQDLQVHAPGAGASESTVPFYFAYVGVASFKFFRTIATIR